MAEEHKHGSQVERGPININGKEVCIARAKMQQGEGESCEAARRTHAVGTRRMGTLESRRGAHRRHSHQPRPLPTCSCGARRASPARAAGASTVPSRDSEMRAVREASMSADAASRHSPGLTSSSRSRSAVAPRSAGASGPASLLQRRSREVRPGAGVGGREGEQCGGGECGGACASSRADKQA